MSKSSYPFKLCAILLLHSHFKRCTTHRLCLTYTILNRLISFPHIIPSLFDSFPFLSLLGYSSSQGLPIWHVFITYILSPDISSYIISSLCLLPFLLCCIVSPGPFGLSYAWALRCIDEPGTYLGSYSCLFLNGGNGNAEACLTTSQSSITRVQT